MIRASSCAVLVIFLLTVDRLPAQSKPPSPSPTPSQSATPKPWGISLTLYGYLPSDQDGYANPNVTADHGRLHLEARYNYEDLRTGSLWAGYNFHAGKTVELKLTPMIGGVFGRTQGIAPGCQASLRYRKVELSISNEYVFSTSEKAQSFYYSWPELTYSPVDWLSLGLAAQRTKPIHTKLDTQRGFVVGLSHKHAEFRAYVFNVGWTNPSLVLEVGWTF
ncbi:MAG TPA: hypothetical protein VKL40_09770 [Candidatus Angelobacter sp.]|nr:hypothetical protein [Candidatus Angelobacter sp.]